MPSRAHTHCLTPRERLDYGVTAVLVNTATGETRDEVVRGGMTTREATRAVAKLCDDLGPDWKVRVLSSPVTIFADLQNYEGRERQRPEGMMLGAIGRGDLVEWRSKYVGLKTEAERVRRRRDV